MTAFVPYVTFMKHAKKAARGRAVKTRPVLSTVLHKEDYVAVTDSYRLYLAKDVYEGEEKTLDAQTGQEVNHGNYPDVERLISDSSDAKYSHEVDVTSAYESVRAIEIAGRVNKATDLMQIDVNDGSIVFRTDGKTAFDVRYEAGSPLKESDEADVITLQTKYVKEALHVLKDAGISTFTAHYHGNFRPLQIVAGNFTAIVLPIRTVK